MVYPWVVLLTYPLYLLGYIWKQIKTNYWMHITNIFPHFSCRTTSFYIFIQVTLKKLIYMIQKSWSHLESGISQNYKWVKSVVPQLGYLSASLTNLFDPIVFIMWTSLQLNSFLFEMGKCDNIYCINIILKCCLVFYKCVIKIHIFFLCKKNRFFHLQLLKYDITYSINNNLNMT